MIKVSGYCYMCGADLTGKGGSVFPAYNDRIDKKAIFCRECADAIEDEIDKHPPFESFDHVDEFVYRTIEEMKKEREDGNHGQ